jgi:hypothetical protein
VIWPSLITNADQGVLVSWGLDFPAYCGGNGVGCVASNTQCKFTLISGGHVTTDKPLDLSGRTSCFEPSLQAQDGSVVGMVYPQNGASPFMADFAQSAKLNWSVVGDFQPQIATADGGVIATNNDTGAAITFDATGKATGQMGSLPTQSWTGGAYRVGSIDSVIFPAISTAGGFWALAGGNASGTSVAIQQVLTIQAQQSDEQLPCDICGPVWGNINLIELLTSQSVDYIFQNYIQTFAAVTHNHSSQMNFTGAGHSPDVNVTGTGQILTITLSRPASLGQGAFQVMTERVDSANHVISAVTLQGHPLAGWRYWRVYSVGHNDIVIETGGYDGPGPGAKNYVGYYLASGEDGMISRGWREYVRYVQSALGAPHGLQSGFDLGGTGVAIPWHELFEGFWDHSGLYKNYILNNVCQSASCN